MHHPGHQPPHPPQQIEASRGAVGTGVGTGVLFGKSASLIFPTGVVDGSGSTNAASTASNATDTGQSSERSKTNQDLKCHKINLLLDQCETIRFPFKKKLMLNSLDLTAADIPVKDLYGTNLGNSLHKLSLAGNRLSTVPQRLVSCLPILKTLDLSQCELHQLPERWNLPQLKRLNLSHNRLTDFPEEVCSLDGNGRWHADTFISLTTFLSFSIIIDHVGGSFGTARAQYVREQSISNCRSLQSKIASQVGNAEFGVQ
jgi:Leucine-rich repeat (LRR) protein